MYQPVSVEVATVIPGESLGQDHRGNLGGPQAAPAQLDKACPLAFGY